MTKETGALPQVENMKIVIARWPEIGRVLQGAPRPAEVTLVTHYPCPTLFIDGIHMSSGYDPVREAELQAALVPEDCRSAWVYGVGAGHLPRVLLKRAALARLTVVIMNHGIAALSMAYFEHADWLADPRVKLVLAEHEQEIRVPFAAVPPCLQLASDVAAKLRDLVFLELATPFIRKRHQADDAVLQQRLEDNRPYVQGDGDVVELFDTRRGATIVVAAAGPTLAEHFEWLVTQKGKLSLIAVDAAVKPLVENGVVPDVVVSSDRQEVVSGFFAETDLGCLQKSILVYLPMVHGDALRVWPGRRLTFYSSDPVYENMRNFCSKGLLFDSGSVLHPAVDLAVKMGAQKVILLGADFAFPTGRSHVVGCHVLSERRCALDEGVHWVLDGYGERVATAPSYRGYLRDLERYIGQHTDVFFVCGSRSGARIEGTSFLGEEFDV